MLYSAVGELAQLDQDSIVLDVCCGTGTIGISLAKVMGFFFFLSMYRCCVHFLISHEAGQMHTDSVSCCLFLPPTFISRG